MREAAQALLHEQDSSRWLDSLVPCVLSALRSLPGAQCPRDAVQVCAAAVTALHNMLAALSQPHDKDRFCAMLEADDEACCALLHWGVCCPEASEQLPHGQSVPMTSRPLTKIAGTDGSNPFWTPCTRCLKFLSSVTYRNNAALRIFKKGVDSVAVERVLRVAVQYPWGRPPPHQIPNAQAIATSTSHCQLGRR
jgi:hypothetical protein